MNVKNGNNQWFQSYNLNDLVNLYDLVIPLIFKEKKKKKTKTKANI